MGETEQGHMHEGGPIPPLATAVYDKVGCLLFVGNFVRDSSFVQGSTYYPKTFLIIVLYFY